MIRENEGKIVHKNPSYIFQILEKGGGYIQKYDAVEGEYQPDRSLTPYVLEPILHINDPSGVLPVGDYTRDMVNVRWTVQGRYNGEAWKLGTDYTVNPETHVLTVTGNLDVDYTGHISFHADWLNPNSGRVQYFDWERDITCSATAGGILRLAMPGGTKFRLLPWRNRGQFAIPSQLYRGGAPLSDDQAVYVWRVWDGSAFRTIQPDDSVTDLWYKSGKDTKQIVVDQNYIQDVLLQVQAHVKGDAETVRSMTVLLRRWYGQYDDRLDFLTGKYIFPDTTRAEAEVVVTNTHGDIANPEHYFDIEIFYTVMGGAMQHVAHGPRGEVTRSQMPVDPTMRHSFGWMIREKTALIPLLCKGKYLAIGGKVAVAQFPSTPRDE